MGCQLHGHTDKSRLECNLTDASFWIISVCDEFNPKIIENYEFEDISHPNIPTYQTGISSEAIIKANKIAPINYNDLNEEWQKRMDESEFLYARKFLTECANNKSYVNVSY